jgi:very-short-patch-repair endonuclease
VHDLLDLLGPKRTASTAALATVAGERSVRRWVGTGRLVRLHPGWVTIPSLAEDWTVRAHAATGYAGGPLSHMSALAVHGVVDYEVTRIDVTVRDDRRVRTSRWLRVHRSRNPFDVVQARGLPATTIARSLVDTWGAAHRARAARGFNGVARDAVLRASRERRMTVARLDAELALRPELPGRSALCELLGLIAAGAQSPLELTAVRQVLDISGLPRCEQQHRIVLPSGPVHLDAAWPDVKLAIELDGAAFHGSNEARERDLARDAALAALGWLVIRFSYRQVTQQPSICRARIEAAYRARLSIVP